MSNVSPLRQALPFSNEVVIAMREMDRKIIEAINEAQAAGIPRGLLVGTLHGYALEQTTKMINAAD